MNTTESTSALGWKSYFFRLVFFTSTYTALWLIVVPEKPMAGMRTKAGEVLSVVLPTMFMYLSVYLVAAVIGMVIYKILKKGDIHVTNILAKALFPSFIISLLLIFGSWYGATH